LRAVLEEEILPEKRKNLEYIELRFGNLAPYKYKEKTAIVVKEGILYRNRIKTTIINESLESNDKEYLLFVASCFLEDYLSQGVLKKYQPKNS